MLELPTVHVSKLRLIRLALMVVVQYWKQKISPCLDFGDKGQSLEPGFHVKFLGLGMCFYWSCDPLMRKELKNA